MSPALALWFGLEPLTRVSEGAVTDTNIPSERRGTAMAIDAESVRRFSERYRERMLEFDKMFPDKILPKRYGAQLAAASE